MIYDGNTNVFGRTSGDLRDHIRLFLFINWNHNINWLRWWFNFISYILLCSRNNRFNYAWVYFSITKKQICILLIYLRMQVWVSIVHPTDIELRKTYKSLWMLYGECKNVIITSFHTNWKDRKDTSIF